MVFLNGRKFSMLLNKDFGVDEAEQLIENLIKLLHGQPNPSHPLILPTHYLILHFQITKLVKRRPQKEAKRVARLLYSTALNVDDEEVRKWLLEDCLPEKFVVHTCLDKYKGKTKRGWFLRVLREEFSALVRGNGVGRKWLGVGVVGGEAEYSESDVVLDRNIAGLLFEEF